LALLLFHISGTAAAWYHVATASHSTIATLHSQERDGCQPPGHDERDCVVCGKTSRAFLDAPAVAIIPLEQPGRLGAPSGEVCSRNPLLFLGSLGPRSPPLLG
jgi:hypothetical protein